MGLPVGEFDYIDYLMDGIETEVSEKLNYYIRFKDMIIDLATSFVNLTADKIDQEMELALQQIGEFIGADRCYIFLRSLQGNELYCNYQWTARNTEPLSEFLKLQDTDYPWLYAKLDKMEVVKLDSLDQLPEKASQEKEFFTGQKVKSVMLVPIAYQKELIGFMGLEYISREKKWLADTISMLTIIAAIFASGIVRQRNEQIYWNLIALQQELIANQQMTEQALRESEKNFREITNNMYDMVCKTDKNWKIEYASPSYKKFLGYNPESLLGRNIFELIHPEDFARVKDAINVAMNNKSEGKIDYRIKHADGHYIWLETAGKILFDQRGQYVGAVFNARDETERKKLEEKLKAKSEEQEMLLENIDTHVFYLRDPKTHGYVNRAAAAFLGLKKEEMQNRRINEFFSQEQAQAFIEKHLQVFSEKRQIKHEYEVKNIKGENRHLSSTLTPKLNKDGEVEYVVCAVNDITEIKRAKKELEKSYHHVSKLARDLDQANKKLRASERLFRINFEESNIGMAIGDTEGRYLKVNQALCKMLGYTVNELKNKSFKAITHPLDLEKSVNVYERLVKGQLYTANYEKRLVSKNGRIIWVNLNVSMARDEEGKPLFLLNQLENITEKRLAEIKVREQEEEIKRRNEELEYNKLKTKFFANLSHELRTPLNLIFSTLQMITVYKDQKLNLADDPRLNRYLQLIKQNGYRLLRLVNNLIDLTKMDADAYHLNLNNYDIVAIIREIARSVEDYMQNRQRNFSFVSNLKKKIIACDPFNMERIILNLISNAVKFTDEGDSIRVSLTGQDDRVTITVLDSGIGIEQDKQEIIFEQFRQVDDSFKRNTEGSGIGLSLVKSLVELHQGSIRVESELGKGSSFIIELPLRVLPGDQIKQTEKHKLQNLIDKIDVEFSDIYDL